MPRREPYTTFRVRESICEALDGLMVEEGRLGSMNIFIEEIILQHLRRARKEKPPSDGS